MQDAVFLSLVTVYNIACAVGILASERRRKSDFNAYYMDHKAAVWACTACAIFKPNFLLLLDSRLFEARCGTFAAPLPTKLRTKFRVASWMHLLCEDVVQVILVVLLQNRFLGGWTTLNLVTFCASVASILASVATTGYHNVKA